MECNICERGIGKLMKEGSSQKLFTRSWPKKAIKNQLSQDSPDGSRRETQVLAKSEVIEEVHRQRGGPTLTISLRRNCSTADPGREDMSWVPKLITHRIVLQTQ